LKKIQNYLIAFILVGILAHCTDKKPTVEETSNKDRNMFGLYIPRGLTKTTEGLVPGYALFRPANSASVYLVNRKGKVVHEWKGNYEVNSFYLNEDGSLTLLSVDPDFPVFGGGGNAGRIQKISWDSKMLWDFEYATEEYLTHHDIAVMPNGNILAIAWEAMTAEEVLKAGRKPEFTPKAGLWPDKIIEIKPMGKNGAEIVWEWHIWDHLIQDYDETKDNYGDVAAHPELLDINKDGEIPPLISHDSMAVLHKLKRAWRNQTVENRGADVYHFNAIDYNPKLDQIVFSSPNLDEIFIIDHSTTTEEAAGHSGGAMGLGGDFLYRWGNPGNYNHGDSTDQKLYGQHDARWIEKGLPGAGNLTVFNNDVPMGPDSLDYSAVYELETPMDSEGNYVREEDGKFGPKEPIWKYIAPDTLSFYGSFISGAQRMKNGNTFINEGPKGRFFEVTPEGEIVWEYLNPYRGNIHHSDGEPVSPIPLAYWQFRSNFIPADHPALKEKELKPLDPQPEPFVMLPPAKEDKKE